MKFAADETTEKLRGGYYTDATVVAYLLRWVRGVRPRALLEPSCGDGAFLRGLAGPVPIDSLERVVACERDPLEAERASVALAAIPAGRRELHVGDFLAWALDRQGSEPEVDAVVGNPPFVRYQYLDAGAQERALTLLRRAGLTTTRHANAWVPFLVAGLERLRPGGRLGMVIPAELLHVLHAEPARAALLAACARIIVIDPAERWFEGALQGVVLVLAERRREDGPPGAVAILPAPDRSFLLEDPEAHVAQATLVPAVNLPGKWMAATLTEAERSLLAGVRAHPRVLPFGRLASAQVGIVTGANAWFLVPESTVRAHRLEPWARPMFGRSEHAGGAVYTSADHAENVERGLPTSFLWFDGELPLHEDALGYVARGEAEGLHRRFKCRTREPWYRVPFVSLAPIAMLKRSHHHPRLVLNLAGAYTTDTAYRVRPLPGVDPGALVGSFVSSLTALSAELEGRHYGGGVLELVPSEIRHLLVAFDAQAQPEALDALLRSGTPTLDVLAHQDQALLPSAGLTPGDILALQTAWSRLRNRRQRTPVD